MFDVKRPALKYYGGKWRLASRIIKMFPTHIAYVEPFGGGANILLQKGISPIEVYNDINSDVVRYFRVLRDCPNALISKILLTPISREELEFCRNADSNVDEIELARRFFVTSWFSIMGVGGNVTTSSSDFRYYTRSPRKGYFPTEDDLYIIANRLNSVYIEHLDFMDCIHRYDEDTTLFYVDPPYYGKCGDYYKFAISDEDHIKLADILNKIKGLACVSAVESDLYNKLYSYWKCIDLRAVNAMGITKSEKLWMNYEFEGSNV